MGDVVSIIRAELEESKNKIIQNVAEDGKKLKQYEDGILEDLETAEGNILDNQRVISSLRKAQVLHPLRHAPGDADRRSAAPTRRVLCCRGTGG